MTPEPEYDEWLRTLSTNKIRQRFLELGVTEILVKCFPGGQGNAKNQIYCGKDLVASSKIPSGEVVPSETNSTKPGAKGKTKYQASVDLQWLGPCEMHPLPAPNAKLIYYPQYPEVRLSGFLLGCPDPPRSLLTIGKRGSEPGRCLLLGPTKNGTVYGLILPPDAIALSEIREQATKGYNGFRLWDIKGREPDLLSKLRHLVDLKWVPLVRLDSDGIEHPYTKMNALGYTLEAHLGVTPNGRAEPDLDGWELKAHSIRTLDSRPTASAITLMTPEPDGGMYTDTRYSLLPFMLAFGHSKDFGRWDFTGRRSVGEGLELHGYRSPTDFDTDGYLAFVENGVVGATWSFTKILDHWKRKHSSTCFVGAEVDRETGRARFSGNVELGEGTSFQKLLEGLEAGSVYYDPGVNLKLDPEKARWKSKKRNQFRAASNNLNDLYNTFRSVDLTTH